MLFLFIILVYDILLTIEARKQARRLGLGGLYGRIISRSRRMLWMWTNICMCTALCCVHVCDLCGNLNISRMAYIEDNLKVRSRPKENGKKYTNPSDPQEALYRIVDRFKVNKEMKANGEEGSVTNSLTMLTAIPEVDLGLE